MKDSLWQIWYWARWPLGVVLLAYIALVMYRIPHAFEQDKTDKTVAAIHAQKITLADVEGQNLPPAPDPQANNATVAGIDANNNGIRDDVELAIFKTYPTSARIRAAELQYAMAIQLMITSVFNSETWIAAAKETSRGAACIGLTIPNKNLELFLARSKEVENLVINSVERKTADDQAYKFTTSYSLPSTDLCNVDLSTLPN